MAYSFRVQDASLTDAVRRVALSQIDAALEELADPDLPRSETIHQVRKRCKKLRGLIRLVRPGFEDYSRENAAFRDLARTISEERDATASIETLDALKERFGSEVGKEIFNRHRRALVKRRDGLDDAVIEKKLAEFERGLKAARKRASGWTVSGAPENVLAEGMEKTLKRARSAMKTARKSRDPEDFHEWRKRVKYHRYHVRLLKRAWPRIQEPWIEATDELGEALGDHHDLAVFLDETLENIDLPETARKSREILSGLMQAEQDRLEALSLEVGALVHAEPPQDLARRFALYWTTSQSLAA